MEFLNDSYTWLKLIHILSATFLWGTGVGTVFYMFFAHLRQNPVHIRETARLVVLADWIFTAPTFLLIQPLTGYLMLKHAGWSLYSPWLAQVLLLYGIVAVCWFPVVWLQMRLRDLTASLQMGDDLPIAYVKTFKLWLALGVPAAFAMMALFVLMIFKPGMAG